jgi:hypothetical protein
MLNYRAASMQLPSAVEPTESAVIVQNFAKGLMLLRSVAEPVAIPRVIVRIQIRPPKLTQLPAAAAPQKGLALSTLLHITTAAVVVSLPILFPPWLVSVPSDAPNLDREVVYQPLLMPILPKMAETAAGVKTERTSGQKAHSMAEPSPIGSLRIATMPKPDYAGPQMIVSNPPDSTAGVQTIRRPDLISPPKVAYPLRLQSVVVLPRQVVQAPATPRLEQPAPPSPEVLATLSTSKPLAQEPALPNNKPKLLLAPAKPVARKTMTASEPSAPALTAALDPPKAVAIINAVSVPPQPDPVIPEAELASRFVVGPSRATTTVAAVALEAAGGSLAGLAASKAKENLPHTNMENRTRTEVELRDAHAEASTTESSPSAGTRLRSSPGAAPAAAVTNKGLPGISISGGTPGRSGRADGTSQSPHGSYGLTIISGGSSGGASRDLGVFSRSDTVYTVYIPMTDAGGGPDWSIQYALASSLPDHRGLLNGLLTPPVVLKKNQATAPKTELATNSGPVFVTGIIDENGRLQALRAIHALDSRARSAINALSQWEFLAAQLSGKPVASKVLIGVSVIPVEEVGK